LNGPHGSPRIQNSGTPHGMLGCVPTPLVSSNTFFSPRRVTPRSGVGRSLVKTFSPPAQTSRKIFFFFFCFSPPPPPLHHWCPTSSHFSQSFLKAFNLFPGTIFFHDFFPKTLGSQKTSLLLWVVCLLVGPRVVISAMPAYSTSSFFLGLPTRFFFFFPPSHKYVFPPPYNGQFSPLPLSNLTFFFLYLGSTIFFRFFSLPLCFFFSS